MSFSDYVRNTQRKKVTHNPTTVTITVFSMLILTRFEAAKSMYLFVHIKQGWDMCMLSYLVNKGVCKNL